jgi:hypothetical protein
MKLSSLSEFGRETKAGFAEHCRNESGVLPPFVATPRNLD